MKLICCIALLSTGESYFKQLTANNQLGLIAGIRSSNTKVSRTSLYEASSPVDGSLSPDIPDQVILLRESSQTSLHGGQDDEDAKCSHPNSFVSIDSKQLSKAARDLKSEFSRYKLLRDFLEVVPSKMRLPFSGDVTWGEMHPVVALCLGFRVKDGTVRQDDTVEPQGWIGLDIVPDLSDLSQAQDQTVSRMAADLPEDEGATDIVLETLAGLEMYQKMKVSTDEEVQRRILLGKWLYVQGFFNDEFPSTTRFIPANLSQTGDDDEGD